MKRALVTGATGVVGHHLVRRLLDDGIPVTALARTPASVSASIEGADIVQGDVRDAGAIEHALKHCSHVFHLAAEVDHAQSVEELFGINVLAVETIARACLAQGVERLVFTSSNAVYGRAVIRHGLTEESALEPDSGYGLSKVRAEQVLNGYYRQSALPAVIVRTSNVAAPDTQAWSSMYERIARNQFHLIGRGDGLHTFTAMSDFVDALLLCAIRPGIEGQTYIIVNDPPVHLRDWLAIFAEEAGTRAPVPALPDWPLYAYGAANRVTMKLSGRLLPKADRLNLFYGSRSFDCMKARRELGFDPKLSGPDVIRLMARGLRDRRITSGQERAR